MPPSARRRYPTSKSIAPGCGGKREATGGRLGGAEAHKVEVGGSVLDPERLIDRKCETASGTENAAADEADYSFILFKIASIVSGADRIRLCP